MSFETSAFIVTWLAIILLGLGMSGLLRQIRLLAQQVEGGSGVRRVNAMVGRPLPFLGNGSAPHIGEDRPALLVFAKGDCEVCEKRLSELSEFAAASAGVVDYGAVFPGSPQIPHSSTLRIFSERQESFDDLGIRATPFGIVVKDGLITKAQRVGSRDELEQLVGSVGGDL